MSHDHHDHGHHHDGHGHDHHHDGHGHGRVPEAFTSKRELAAGAGRGRVLFFDAFSGIAGDMTIAALADLGVAPAVFEAAWSALPIEGYRVHFGHAARSGIVGCKVDVELDGTQPSRTYRDIATMLASASLTPEVKRLAQAIFRRLAESEAEMHRMPIDEVHFHEVGAVDAIVDVVGAAAGIAHLQAEVVLSPLPMGHGFVRAQHGVLPLPAPATVRCLTGVPTYGVELEAELVTPTGAAIAATIARRFARWPHLLPEHVGFGVGTKRFPDRPNLLRVVLGAAEAAEPTGLTHVVVEANVDDMTGELAGHAIACLLDAGALDAWAIPTTTKKGRPALTLCALGPAERGDHLANVLMRETTTIGVRFQPVSRRERPRETVEVSTDYGRIPVKVSGGPYGPAQVKPEFDRCAELAAAACVPVREVIRAALAAYASG